VRESVTLLISKVGLRRSARRTSVAPRTMRCLRVADDPERAAVATRLCYSAAIVCGVT